LPSHDIIFIGDESNSWYNAIIEGLPCEHLEDNLDFLSEKLSCYENVKVIGASMGGYAALFAYDLPTVDFVMALQPQFFIKPGWPRATSCNSKVVLNRLDNFSVESDKPINIVVGECCLFDIYQASLALGNRFGDFCTVVPQSYHNVGLLWHERNILGRALGLFASGHYSAGMSPYGSPYPTSKMSNGLYLNEFVAYIDEYYHELYDNSCESRLKRAWRILSCLPEGALELPSVFIEKGILASVLNYDDLALDILKSAPRLVEDKYGPLAAIYARRSQYEEFGQCLKNALSASSSDGVVSFLRKRNFTSSMSSDQLGSLQQVINGSSVLRLGYSGLLSVIDEARSSSRMPFPTMNVESDLDISRVRDERAASVMKSLEGELASLKGERDAAAKEKAAAQQSTTELKQQLSAQAETLQQAQKARDEQVVRVKSLEGELASLKGERDAAAKEKAAAQQSATELKQQLSAQAETLQQAQKARDEQVVRVKSLEGELATLNTQQSSVAAGLQRLRHLAHPVGRTP
jgi:hypothetical protein